MKSYNMPRGSTLTVVELIIAILLLVVLLVMIVGYRISRTTVSVTPATQQQVATTTIATENNTEVAWVPQSTTKKTSTKKKTTTKVVTVTPKKNTTVATTTTSTPKTTLTVTKPVVLEATPSVEVTHTNTAGDAETPLEADCAKVLVVTKPHALQSVGSTITVAGSMQNCNWIPTSMPKLFVIVTDSLAGFPENIMVPQQQLYLPGSLTTQVYDFSKTMQLTRQPNNTTGYVMFTGTDSIGNPIRNVIIPITFK